MNFQPIVYTFLFRAEKTDRSHLWRQLLLQWNPERKHFLECPSFWWIPSGPLRPRTSNWVRSIKLQIIKAQLKDIKRRRSDQQWAKQKNSLTENFVSKAENSHHQRHPIFPGIKKHCANHRESYSKLHHNKNIKTDWGFLWHESYRNDVEPENQRRWKQSSLHEPSYHCHWIAPKGFQHRWIPLLQYGLSFSQKVQIEGKYDRIRMIIYI